MSRNKTFQPHFSHFFSIKFYKVENEYLSNVKIGLVQCYCEADLSDRLHEEFDINGTNLELCYLWFKQSLFVNGLPFAIVILIIFINMIIQRLFQGYINSLKFSCKT